MPSGSTNDGAVVFTRTYGEVVLITSLSVSRDGAVVLRIRLTACRDGGTSACCLNRRSLIDGSRSRKELCVRFGFDNRFEGGRIRAAPRCGNAAF